MKNATNTIGYKVLGNAFDIIHDALVRNSAKGIIHDVIVYKTASKLIDIRSAHFQTVFDAPEEA